MRRAAIYTAGVLALLAAPGAARAGWLLHPHHHHQHPHLWQHFHQHHQHAAPNAFAAPLGFRLPFGFGVDVSGVQLTGPLGGSVHFGDRGERTAPPPPPPPPPAVTIDASTKAEIRQVGTDLDALLNKTSKLSQRMVDPNTQKPFADLAKSGTTTPATSTSKTFGGPKDKDGVSDAPGGSN